MKCIMKKLDYVTSLMEKSHDRHLKQTPEHDDDFFSDLNTPFDKTLNVLMKSLRRNFVNTSRDNEVFMIQCLFYTLNTSLVYLK